MNAWGRVSLAAVRVSGLFAGDDGLRDEEYLVGLADQAAYEALPMARKVEQDAEAYWHDFEARAVEGYAAHTMDTRLKHSVKLAHNMTMDWCAGRWPRHEAAPKVEWLKALNRALDKHQTRYRQQREAELRTEVAAWERAALARLGAKQAVTVTPVVTLAEAA